MNVEELRDTYISLVKEKGMHIGNERAFIELAKNTCQFVKDGKMKYEDYYEYMTEQISNLRNSIEESKKQKKQEMQKVQEQNISRQTDEH